MPTPTAWREREAISAQTAFAGEGGTCSLPEVGGGVRCDCAAIASLSGSRTRRAPARRLRVARYSSCNVDICACSEEDR